MKISDITTDELAAAFSVLKQLRSGLDFATFVQRLHVQERAGYRLLGAFDESGLLGLVGLRMVHTFARGLYTEVDDLVVDEAARKKGVGKVLMEYARTYASERGADWVFLNARNEAIPFYVKLGFEHHGSPAMKLPIS